MAIRNRKLFPTVTDTNQTTYCPEFCDPTTCPYDCPEFYLYPPPPPALALALPPSPASQPGHDKLSPSFITASALLVGFFVLLGYYLITAKSCFRQRPQNRRPPAPSDGGDEEFVDGNRVDHPIWFIATVGLQQSVINAITVCNYRKGDGLIEGTECSVCLNEFREGENLRLLPKCSHAFHIPCIDRWLGSHTNCPLCRANIVSPDSIGVFSTRPLQELMPMEPQGQDSTLSIDIQAEDFRERNGISGNLGINGVSGNMGGTGERRDTQERGDRGERILKESVNRDSGIQETQKEAAEEMESVKSSSSSVPVNALSSSAESCPIGTRGLDLAGEGGGFAKTGVVGPVAAARSLSCNGGFYLSRHSRSTSSILP